VDCVGVVLDQGDVETEPMSKLPSLSSETEMLAFAAEISLRSELANAEREEVTMHSGTWRGGDRLLGIEGYAMTMEDGDFGSGLLFASRGRNCWTVNKGDTRRVLIVSTMSEGGSRASGPSLYPEQPGKTTRPANVMFPREEPCNLLDLVEELGDDEREDFNRRSRMGSRLGCTSTAGFGTVDVKSIQRGRRSAFASCWTSESSSVEDTVT
jgi:hypothetical protein